MTTTATTPPSTGPGRAILATALLGTLTLLTGCGLDPTEPTHGSPVGPIVATPTPKSSPTVTVGPGASPVRHRFSMPGLSGLDPALQSAVTTAATDARADGVTLTINSGKRTAAEQEKLLRKAIKTYGSEAEARRWVATPDTSPHVSGDAVDIGPAEAATWLERHGPAYGLCRTYRNEPWHFELRPDAATLGCPAMYPDPTHDPRMQQ